jgi:galactose-1-phosphate uridylyltransferase
MFTENGEINMQAVAFFNKFSIVMSKVNLKNTSPGHSSEYLKSQTEWVTYKVSSQCLDHSQQLLRLTRSELNHILQLTFSHLEQLIVDIKLDPAHIKFQ